VAAKIKEYVYTYLDSLERAGLLSGFLPSVFFKIKSFFNSR